MVHIESFSFLSWHVWIVACSCLGCLWVLCSRHLTADTIFNLCDNSFFSWSFGRACSSNCALLVLVWYLHSWLFKLLWALYFVWATPIISSCQLLILSRQQCTGSRLTGPVIYFRVINKCGRYMWRSIDILSISAVSIY